MMLKAVCQCSSRFVSDSIVRVPVCVRVLLRQTRCSGGLFFGANLYTVLDFLSRATFLHTSMIPISLSHCTITGLRKLLDSNWCGPSRVTRHSPEAGDHTFAVRVPRCSQHLLAVGREDCRTDPVCCDHLKVTRHSPEAARPHLRALVVRSGQHLLAVGREDC